MKYAITTIVFAGLAMTAGAQDFSLTMVGGAGAASITDFATFTVDVYGDASVGTHMMGGSFVIEAATSSFEVLDMEWTAAPWSMFNTDGGHTGGGNYDPVIFGQLIVGIPPFDQPAAGSELGSLIGSFQITTGQLGFWSIELNIVLVEPYDFEVLDNRTGQIYRSSDGNLTLGSFKAHFIPAPSSLALLGLGGLAVARRRR